MTKGNKIGTFKQPIKVNVDLAASDTETTEETEETEETEKVVSDENTTVNIEVVTENVAGVNLLSDEEVNNRLANTPMPSITKEYMKGRIVDIKFTRLSGTVTDCQITLDNGYSTSESACVNQENYNQEIGERLSYNSAFGKLWPLFGFLLAEKNHLNKISN